MTMAPPLNNTVSEAVLARARAVLDIEIQALEDVKTQLDDGFLNALNLLEACQGRVIVTGMGKSGHIGRKLAATLASTGTPATFLHPAEGSHGDAGVIMPQDVVLALSNSGETPEILNLLPVIQWLGVPMIAMTGRPDSTLARQSQVVLTVRVQQEACPLNLAPTASTTAALALGDALAVLLLERKGFTPDDFALRHPAGSLGKRLLLKVSDLVRQGDALPVVRPDTPFLDALVEMSAKRLGMTLVLDDAQQMVGILTDGDVRRAMLQNPDVRGISVAGVMTRQPKTAAPEMLAMAALRQMETLQITCLVVVDADGLPVGVLTMHDLLRAGL